MIGFTVVPAFGEVTQLEGAFDHPGSVPLKLLVQIVLKEFAGCCIVSQNLNRAFSLPPPNRTANGRESRLL